MKAITVIEREDGSTSLAVSGLTQDPGDMVDLLHRGIAHLTSLPPATWLKGADDE